MDKRHPAIFFDRDGVLNIDHGYTYRSEEFEWVVGAKKAIQHFNQQGYYVFVVTNQSGIARGFYTEEEVQKLHAFMNKELSEEGAHINAFYYCPHHMEGIVPKYTMACQCRKPMPGMLLQAIEEWRIDPATSLMIGDRPSDIEAAKAAGIPGYLFSGKDLYKYVKGIIK